MPQALDAFGLGPIIKDNRKALIKINMDILPRDNFPRTDIALLQKVIEYVAKQDSECVVAEGANGHLYENLVQMGLESEITKYDVKIIDLDSLDSFKVNSMGQEHYIPHIFNDYKVRIGLPSTSKRERLVFSSNVKLFVGATPRQFYLNDPNDTHRTKIHNNLDISIASIYKCFLENAPFCCFINGGKVYQEGRGNFYLDNVLIGNDALELDHYLIDEIYKIETPEYIRIIESF